MPDSQEECVATGGDAGDGDIMPRVRAGTRGANKRGGIWHYRGEHAERERPIGRLSAL